MIYALAVFLGTLAAWVGFFAWCETREPRTRPKRGGYWNHEERE